MPERAERDEGHGELLPQLQSRHILLYKLAARGNPLGFKALTRQVEHTRGRINARHFVARLRQGHKQAPAAAGQFE